MFTRDEDILKAAAEWRQKGRGVALATVIETWGSAPRPVGSNLVIDEEGNFLIHGEPVFRGLTGETLVPAGAEYSVGGKRANLAALLSSTSYGKSITVIS